MKYKLLQVLDFISNFCANFFNIAHLKEIFFLDILEVVDLNKVTLGNSGIEVSEFCLGVLPMGPLQADLPENECINLIKRAIDNKVNFLDTAEMYSTQTYVGEGIKNVNRKDIVIATKSFAKTYDEMADSVNRSLEELGTDYIDIYHLHAARASETVFDKRKGALDYLKKARNEGIIRAIGISTHGVRAVNKAAEVEDIDVVYPLINKKGMGIVQGSLEDMTQAIKRCHQARKGIYAMKVLAGGNLIDDLEASLNFVRDMPEIDSISIGVTSELELYYNLHQFGVQGIDIDSLPDPRKRKKLYIAKLFCTGCGECVKNCPSQALELVDEKARVDHDKCIFCGYCSPECPSFAIRLL